MSEEEKKAEKEIVKEQPKTMDESCRSLIQVIQFIRCTLRGYFGESFADKWGFFVDRNMSTAIHSYLDWVEYPMGDRVLEGHKDQVYCVVITGDGLYLFSGSEDKHIIKWDLRTNEVITRIEASSEAVMSLAHTPGVLVSGGWDGKITVRNDADCSLIRTMEGHSKTVITLSLNKHGTTLVSGSWDYTCRLWSVNSGECMKVMKGHEWFVTRVLFAGDLVISGSCDQSIRIWNPESGKELREITDGIYSRIYDISINSDSSMLACSYSSGLTLFKYPSMEVISKKEMETGHCCFHPSNPILLALDDDDSIRVYRTDTSEFIRTVIAQSESLYSLRFSPDGCRLISLSDDQNIRVWDLSDL